MPHFAILLTDGQLYAEPFRLAATGLLINGYDGQFNHGAKVRVIG
jgi:hypothetical protein